MKKYTVMLIAVLAFAAMVVPGASYADPVVKKFTAPVVGTDKSFNDDVIKSDQPVILEFWAPWCGHCRNMAKTMDELARELSGKVKVVKIDVDKYHETADKFKVQGIPAFYYFKDGKEAGSAAGEMSKEQLKKKFGI